MAGFMKNAMSYLGMSDVVDDEDDYIEEDEEQKPASKSAFDSDHTVTPLASTTAPAASSTTKPFPGGRVNRITTIHRSHMRMLNWSAAHCVTVFRSY